MHSINYSCRAMYFLAKTCLCGTILMLVASCAAGPAHAQSQPGVSPPAAPLSSKTGSWHEAVRLLNSDDSAEIDQAESVLRESLRTPERAEEMACGLVLICMKRQDTSAAIKAISGIRKVFPNPKPETQSFVARAQLWILLAQTDPELARKSTPIFRDLVLRTCRDKTLSPATLRANAMAVGVTCGMLRSEMSGKWIAEKDLDVAEKCMLEAPAIEISSSFKNRLGEAVDRAALIEATIVRIRKLDPGVVATEQSVREERLTELRADFDSVKEASLEIIRNAREAAKKNASERRQLSELLRGLEREWKLVTPGHPGPAPRKPEEPRRSDVRVNEYEWRTEFENVHDANGNITRQQTTKRVHRDSRDIEFEKDREYDRLRSQYRREKEEYEWDRQQHAQLLADWTQRDSARRTNLKTQQTAALTRREELEQLDDARKKEQADAATELTDRTSELEKLADEYELTQLALETVEEKTTTIAFQPPHFKVLDLNAETLALQNRIRAVK